jgi:hypothetical protein
MERLINIPGFDLTGRAEAYGSSNTLGGLTPYYNPSQDLSLTGDGIGVEMSARSTTAWSMPSVDAGLYAEQGYANNWIGTINYGTAGASIR